MKSDKPKVNIIVISYPCGCKWFWELIHVCGSSHYPENHQLCGWRQELCKEHQNSLNTQILEKCF